MSEARCSCGARLRGGCVKLGKCSACLRKERAQRAFDADNPVGAAIERIVEAEEAGKP